MASQRDYAISLVHCNDRSRAEDIPALRRCKLFPRNFFTKQNLWLTQLQKVLRLLQSYKDFFDVPDYDLIYEEADFRILTSSRRAASVDTPNPRPRETSKVHFETKLYADMMCSFEFRASKRRRTSPPLTSCLYSGSHRA